ncbi:PAS domain S-box-containing protein/diguanylate cyclase (GGDEF) domain-containing protein [Noviherbaspirillum humi]|uniref:diguanylate cyclase n=1 Tax=Noviherbaspirillum humi TaxID=1688639 RepID=A0A239I0R1_9BURK|nr:diguanylate cyclase [Noviherbaspirillum humi]SNS87416.1 PAS domain S-box-containing protein/diguanylate cyclase (GGDEF) domain-containing protein [Noviherbaspirillum humi]
MLTDALEAEHEALLQFLYMAPVGLVKASLDGEVHMMNPLSAQLLMPLAADSDLSNLFDALATVAPDLRHRCASFPSKFGTICDALRVQVSAGIPGKRDAQYLSITILKLDGERLMAVLSDVSVQVKQERLLEKNRAWFNAIFSGIQDYALVGLDSQGRIEDSNDSITRLTGLTPEQVEGTSYALFYPPDAITPERMLDRLHEADEAGWNLHEGYCVRADGSRFWASSLIVPLQYRTELGLPAQAGSLVCDEASYCLVIRNINDRKDAAESQHREALCDHLTGIANRRAFFEAAELELARVRRMPRPTSVAVFDADHFKRINDGYGHAAGDAVLFDLAEKLRKCFRQIDVPARIGGEEFAVLLPSTDLEAAQVAAERFRAMVEHATVSFNGMEIPYTISGGIACLSDEISGLGELLGQADQALYRAKQAGRNRICSWHELASTA